MKPGHLEIYLIDLLKENDCVIVPGFGGFILNKQQAKLSGRHHIVRPPAKVITYNKSLQLNDGLLAQRIAASAHIGYNNALEHLDTEVKNWSDKLEEKKRLALPAVGTFTASDENKLSFEPDYHLNFQHSSYGLSPVQLIPVDQVKEEAPVVKPLSSTKVNKWLGAAAAVAAFFLLASLLFNNIKQNNISPQQANVHDNTVESLAGILNDSSVALPDMSAVEYDYYIIGGSFSILENATEFATSLKERGFKSVILDNEAGFHRVAYQMEQDSVSAEFTLEKIKTEENQSAWILKW